MRQLTSRRSSYRSAHMLPSLNGQRGIIQILVIIIIALVLLRWLGINITTLLAKPGVHDFAVFVKENLKLVWHDLKEIFFFFKSA